MFGSNYTSHCSIHAISGPQSTLESIAWHNHTSHTHHSINAIEVVAVSVFAISSQCVACERRYCLWCWIMYQAWNGIEYRKTREFTPSILFHSPPTPNAKNTREGGKGRLYELCNRYYVSFPFVWIGQLLTLAAKWHVPEFVDDTIPDTWSYGVSNGHLNESNVLDIWRAMRKTRIFTVWKLIDSDAMLI